MFVVESDQTHSKHTQGADGARGSAARCQADISCSVNQILLSSASLSNQLLVLAELALLINCVFPVQRSQINAVWKTDGICL